MVVSTIPYNTPFYNSKAFSSTVCSLFGRNLRGASFKMLITYGKEYGKEISAENGDIIISRLKSFIMVCL